MLGLALAIDKCTPPFQSLVWLGFNINTINMTLTLPEKKMVEILLECAKWKSKSKTSRKQLQSLAGKLNHLAKCIKPAVRFSNRVLAAIRAAPPVGCHTFNLLDLEWFQKFASTYNGVQLLPSAPRKDWTLECDSTLEVGGATSQLLIIRSSTHYKWHV